MHEFDLIAIGDIVTDAFIRLKDAKLNCDINHVACQICLRFGDKVPFESVTIVPAVGNSPNASVASARLGLKTALYTNLGDDYHGQEAIATLKQEKIDTKFVIKHRGAKTNYHYVLWYEDDRTILIKHEEYPYALPALGQPRWVYLSSLGEQSLDLHAQIASWLAKNPDVKLAFQPGTFQMKLGYEKLAAIYRRAEITFCNREEARRILQTKDDDIKKLLTGIRALGPQIAVITDGPKGAYAADGTSAWFMPPYPDPKPPLERTGAGDAFSATVVATLALGKTLPEALAWGPVNSMSVVQKIGAQAGLLSRPALEQLLASAPTDYQPRKI